MSDTADITADLQHGDDVAVLEAAVAALQENLDARAARVAELEAEVEALEQAASASATQAALTHADPDAIPVPKGTPHEIELTSPHGFFDDGGLHRFWPAGAKITRVGEVAMLIARGALHKVTR